MKDFFNNLISASSDTSSKRFASLLTLVVIISLTFIATYKDEKHIAPEFMFYSLTAIVGAGLGLTAIENITKIKNKTQDPTDNAPTNPDKQS